MSKTAAATAEVDDDQVQHERDAEDADLENLEDGSRITEEHEEAAEQARDARGRFRKTDDEEEGEEAEEEEAEEPAAGKGKKGKGGKEEEETEEEEAEEPEEGADEDERQREERKDRMSRRMQKLARQRDEERQRAARLEADLALERARQTAATKKSELDTIKENLDQLYEEVEKARADGDSKTAAKLQRQIDESNRKIVELETLPKQRAAVQAATEAERFNTLLDVAVGMIPELDPDHDDYDEDAAKEVEFQIQAYERMGVPSSKALRRALMLLYQVDPEKPTKAARRQAAVEESEEEEAPRKPSKKPPNVQRNLEASRRQVRKPDRSGGGELGDEGEIDVSKLSDEEFDAIPDSKLDELGGSKFNVRRRR